MTKEASSALDQWFVTNGVVAQGPLEFDRLARGVAGGQISATSYVRHRSWKVWRELSEIGGLSAADREQTVQRLAGASFVAEERAADPRSTPPPPLEVDIQSDPMRLRKDSQSPLSSVRPASVDPVAVMASAKTLEDALMLMLSTAVAAAKGDVGLLHRSRPELGAVVTSYAQGTGSESLLGARLAADDPALRAAEEGRTILGEPQLGDAGRYIAGRLSPCMSVVRGVAMVPIVVFGKLVALVELGRAQTPFRAREIARVEDVVEALSARMVVEGWVGV